MDVTFQWSSLCLMSYGQDNNFQLLTLIFQHQLVSKCGSAHIGAGNFNHEAGISPQKTPFLGPAAI